MTDTNGHPASLAAALAELQTQLPHVGKGKTAKVVTKEKGTYSYTYADLAAVSRELLPIMGKLGLAFTCRPSIAESGAFVLDYMLMHDGGEQIAGAYPLPATGSPQQIGSAITYARRYCLCAVTGLATDDDDDDGAAAEQVKPQRAKVKPPGPDHERLRHGTVERTPDDIVTDRTRGPVPPGDDMWAGEPPGQLPKPPAYSTDPGSADEKQLKTIHTQLSTLGITDRDARLTRLEQIIKADLTPADGGERSSSNLSRAEAEDVKAALGEAIKAKRLAERAAAS